jgi:hypothetical protein
VKEEKGEQLSQRAVITAILRKGLKFIEKNEKRLFLGLTQEE